MKRLQMRPIPPDERPVCSVEPEGGSYAVALVHYALNTDGTINPGGAQVNARRIVASWNALADADLEALERDGLLAEPRVAALVEAAIGLLKDIEAYEHLYLPFSIEVCDALLALKGERE